MEANGEDKGGHNVKLTALIENDSELVTNDNRALGIRALPQDLVWQRETVSEQTSGPSEEGDPQGTSPPNQNIRDTVSVSEGDNTIVGEVEAFIKRFVFLPEESLYLLVACWAIGTHLHKEVEVFGYLFAYSPEPQSGKTSLLDVLDLLVHNSSGVQHSPTEAMLFRTADRTTQLLDEVDSWTNSDALRGVLNAGYKQGGSVTRCDKDNSFKPTKFTVFAPRALAGIGVSILAPATLDRTFGIAMVRQKKTERRERFRLRTIASQASALKRKIECWAKKNKNAFACIYEPGEFPYLEDFSDRTVEIAEPLAAIVEVAYAKDVHIAHIRETLVQAIEGTRKEQNTSLKEHRVLKCLLRQAADQDPLVGNPKELAGMCANSEEPIDEHAISQTLRKYGFKPKSKRKDGDPAYRYVLPKASLQELVDRWVPKSEDEGINDGAEAS
jgi:hypothetical protein